MSRQNRNLYSVLGASNHSDGGRAEYDLYCTHPKAVEELLKLEIFQNEIWEPCDGLGHISDVLMQGGFNVRRSDILSRGRGIEEINFLLSKDEWKGDIITNVPYRGAETFVRKAISIVVDGCKVAMWLRILFLESQSRKKLFKEYPPKRIWISSSRIPCGKEGKFGASAQGFAWYIWEKGYKGDTIINWF